MGSHSINWENCKKFDDGSLVFSSNKLEIIDNGNNEKKNQNEIKEIRTPPKKIKKRYLRF